MDGDWTPVPLPTLASGDPAFGRMTKRGRQDDGVVRQGDDGDGRMALRAVVCHPDAVRISVVLRTCPAPYLFSLVRTKTEVLPSAG